MRNLIKILVPRQLFMLLVLSTGLLNHVILIPNLLTAAGRDSWLSVIIAYPISFSLLWLIYFIVKNSPSQGFFSMIRERLGLTAFIFLSIPIILFLFASTYVTFKDLMIWLKAYFLADYSVTLITFVLIFVCFLVTMSGIKHMAMSCGFLLPLVVIFGFFIALTNTRLKEPSYLFPLLSNGYDPLLKGVVYVLSGLLEIYLVVLLQPFTQESIKFKHLFILLTVFAGLTFGPLSAGIMEFGPVESMNFRYPAYEQWRVLSIGEYISHLDFFALYQWLSGALIRIGLFMYLIGTFITKKKKYYTLNPILVSILYLLLFGLMMIKIETYDFYIMIYRYFLPGCMVFFLLQILMSAMILFFLKRRDEQLAKKQKLES